MSIVKGVVHSTIFSFPFFLKKFLKTHFGFIILLLYILHMKNIINIRKVVSQLTQEYLFFKEAFESDVDSETMENTKTIMDDFEDFVDAYLDENDVDDTITDEEILDDWIEKNERSMYKKLNRNDIN